jgi:hypothetical protein
VWFPTFNFQPKWDDNDPQQIVLGWLNARKTTKSWYWLPTEVSWSFTSSTQVKGIIQQHGMYGVSLGGWLCLEAGPLGGVISVISSNRWISKGKASKPGISSSNIVISSYFISQLDLSRNGVPIYQQIAILGIWISNIGSWETPIDSFQWSVGG